MHTPVDVLLRTNSLRDFTLTLGTNVRPQGKLNEDPTDGNVVVEFLYDVDDLIDGSFFGERDVIVLDAYLYGGFGFHANVDIGVGSSTDLYDDELWLEARVLGLKRLDAGGNVVSN